MWTNLEPMNIKVCVGRRTVKFIEQGPVEDCDENSICVEKVGTDPRYCHDLDMNLSFQI